MPVLVVVVPQIVFVVTTQAARPLQHDAGTTDQLLAVPGLHSVISSAARQLAEVAKPEKPKSARSGDSVATAFKRIPQGPTLNG